MPNGGSGGCAGGVGSIGAAMTGPPGAAEDASVVGISGAAGSTNASFGCREGAAPIGGCPGILSNGFADWAPLTSALKGSN